MQINFQRAVNVVSIVFEEAFEKQPDDQSDKQPIVAANDNGLRWPLIPFPGEWYASA